MSVVIELFAIVAFVCVAIVRAQVLPTQQHAALMTLYNAIGEKWCLPHR